MPQWVSYIGYVSPMSYYLAGAFRNEFQNNPTALGVTTADATAPTYGNLETLYDFHATLPEALIGILIIGGAYRVFWLVVLKLWETMKRREVLRKVGAARKRARLLFTVGISWRDFKFRSEGRSLEEDILAEMDSINQPSFVLPQPKYSGRPRGSDANSSITDSSVASNSTDSGSGSIYSVWKRSATSSSSGAKPFKTISTVRPRPTDNNEHL